MATLNRTEQILVDRYGALALNMGQLAQEMQVTKPSLQNMVSEDRCPIKSTGKGKLRRFSIINVAKWLDGE